MKVLVGLAGAFERAMISERVSPLPRSVAFITARLKRKLSDSQISDIKIKLGQGGPKSRVAEEFGITRETLYPYLNKHWCRRTTKLIS